MSSCPATLSFSPRDNQMDQIIYNVASKRICPELMFITHGHCLFSVNIGHLCFYSLFLTIELYKLLKFIRNDLSICQFLMSEDPLYVSGEKEWRQVLWQTQSGKKMKNPTDNSCQLFSNFGSIWEIPHNTNLVLYIFKVCFCLKKKRNFTFSFKCSLITHCHKNSSKKLISSDVIFVALIKLPLNIHKIND